MANLHITIQIKWARFESDEAPVCRACGERFFLPGFIAQGFINGEQIQLSDPKGPFTICASCFEAMEEGEV